MDVLSASQDAATELSLGRPTELTDPAISDRTAIKLLRYLTRTCRELNGRIDWSILRTEKTFTTTAAEVQTGAIPSDFGRWIDDAIWNRTTRRQVFGPLSPAEYQNWKAQVEGGIRDQFYIRGTDMLIYPAPPAGETIAYEYIRKVIGTDSLGTTDKWTFTDDGDLLIFDEELVILGVVWRYRKSEGLDYSEEFTEYERRIQDMIKQNGGSRRYDMGTGARGRIIPPIFEDYPT